MCKRRTPCMRNRDFETYAIEISKILFHVRILRPRNLLIHIFCLLRKKIADFRGNCWVFYIPLYTYKFTQKSISLKIRNFLENELKIRI